MKSKSLFAMALMMGVMLESIGKNNYHGGIHESEEDRKRRLADAQIARNKANGLKEFNYPKGSVWSLNQKSADKKAKKLNLF